MDYSLAPVSTPIRKTLAGFDSMLSFSLNGLSKSAGMPQMKLGWIVINGPASDVAEASHHLELILDTYLSVGTPVQQVLPDLFRIGKTIQHQLQKHMCINWEAANHILQNTAAQCLRVEGGWSAPVRLPNMQSEDSWLKTLLAEQSVVVQPGYFFDMPAEPHIVVSLITPPRDFHKGLTRLRTLVSRFIQARTSVLSR